MSRSVVRFACAIVATTFFSACGSAKPASSSAPAASAAQATAAPAGANGFTGTVAETMDSGGYTYARLQAAGKDDIWIAGSEFATKAGDQLTVALEMPMQNFQSKTLNRTFPLIYFVSSVSRDGQALAGAATAPGGAPAMMTSHAPAAADTKVEPIAPAPGGTSIADVWAKRTALAGKEITVRGKIVKVNSAILDRNWIHLQDGSGSATDRTNDLTVTTDAALKVGDTVTITGVLAVGKDFGAGYAYDAILENGRVVK
jgi:hypothetical protein